MQTWQSRVVVLVLLVGGLLPVQGHGQQNRDSLRTVLMSAGITDTSRLSAGVDLVSSFLPNYPDSAFYYCDLMEPLAERSNSDKFRGHILTFRGIANHVTGDYMKSFELHEKALAIRERLGDQTNAARNLQNLGIVSKSLGQYARALDYYQRAYDIFSAKGGKSGMAAALGSMGMIFFEQGYRTGTKQMRDEFNNKALEYLDRGLAIRKELGDRKAYILTLSNRAVVLYELGRVEEAMAAHQETYQIALELGDKIQESSSLNNLGVAYSAMADQETDPIKKDSLLQRSLDHYKRGLEIREAIGHADFIINSLSNIASVLRQLATDLPPAERRRTLEEALSYAQRSMDMANDTQSIREKGSSAETLYLVLKDLGRYEEALLAHEEYMSARDSISSLDKRDDLLRQEMTYDFDKKSLEAEMAYQQTLSEERSRKNTLKYGLAFVGLTLIFALAALLLNRRSAKNLALKNQQIAAEKERAERSEAAKQRFLANMSHEIRTPMNAITGLTRLLLEKQHDDQTRSYLEAIRHSGDNLLVVLNDVLDQSRMEAGKLEIRPRVFDVRRELESLTHMYQQRASDKGLQLEMRISDRTPSWLNGDSVRLSQIISNLVGNAIKFTDRGSVEVNVDYEHGQLMLKVRDTGTGISPEDQARIFEAFEQVTDERDRGRGGTGLGLSISRQLARLMGGELRLRSESGKGSEFSVALPMPEGQASEAGVLTAVEGSDAVKHVIIAEDDDYNYIVTSGTMARYYPNARLFRAHHGEEVLRLLEEDDYDLVLMDVRMPVMDGYATTRAMRSSGWDIPVVALTASVISSDIEACLQAGMNGYIPKPFTDEEFIRGLSIWFQSGVSAEEVNADSEREQFLHHMPDRLKELNNALATQDGNALQEVAHRIRPQLVRCGLANAGALAAEIDSHSTSDSRIFEKGRMLADEIEHHLRVWQK